MSSSALAASIRHLRGKLAAQQRHEDSDEELLHAFLNNRDDSAFAVLVRRHGPMVLHVCRRVLGHQHDAEDAFQATFLVLARNAASLRDKTALASWLHGTAYRTAMKAKQTAARRRKHEGALGAMTQPRLPTEPTDELSWREVRTMLDEEIARLPEIYRSVFVLCCLENVSQEETGRRLGLKQRTVSNRLAEARKRLSRRLSRRGVELTALLAATTLASGMPAGLMAKTVEAASAGGVSAAVAELVQGAASALVASKVKIGAMMVLAMSLLGGGSVYFLASPQRQQGQPLLALRAGEQTARAPHSAKRETAETVEVRGSVLDPDGKPAAGARVYVDPRTSDEEPMDATTTGKAGRFSLTLSRASLVDAETKFPLRHIRILATAKGYGLDWRDVPLDDAGKEITLHLVKDDVPIQGRILNLEGKPLAGIKVSVHGIEVFPKGDLSRVLLAMQNGTQIEDVTERRWLQLSIAHPAPTATTDADGRFLLDGIGRERIVWLQLQGPRIHYSLLRVITRKGESVERPNHLEKIYAATFEYLAKPARLIRGRVREKGTGKPLAGIRVSGSDTTADTLTDEQGRYELPGYAKGDHYGVMAFPLHGQPYFSASVEIKDTEGLGPITADLEMVGGIPFEGKVLDGETGKPVLGGISYYPLAPNPNVRSNRGQVGTGAASAVGPYSGASVSADGSFRCIVLPGPGCLAFQAANAARYMSACVDPGTINAYGRGNREILMIPFRGGSWTGTPQEQFQAILLLNPTNDMKKIAETIRVAVAPELKGRLLDPDGKPVTGARVRGLEASYIWGALATGKFSITGVNPQRPRRVTFIHADRRLIGTVEVKGTDTTPLTVRMQPWAAVRGRLVDVEGRPVRNAVLQANEFLPENGRTDKDGRFLLEGLIPGRNYDFTYEKDKPSVSGTVLKGFTGKPGEVRDLGDLCGQPIRQE